MKFNEPDLNKMMTAGKAALALSLFRRERTPGTTKSIAQSAAGSMIAREGADRSALADIIERKLNQAFDEFDDAQETQLAALIGRESTGG